MGKVDFQYEFIHLKFWEHFLFFFFKGWKSSLQKSRSCHPWSWGNGMSVNSWPETGIIKQLFYSLIILIKPFNKVQKIKIFFHFISLHSGGESFLYIRMSVCLWICVFKWMWLVLLETNERNWLVHTKTIYLSILHKASCIVFMILHLKDEILKMSKIAFCTL